MVCSLLPSAFIFNTVFLFVYNIAHYCVTHNTVAKKNCEFFVYAVSVSPGAAAKIKRQHNGFEQVQ